MNFRARIPSDPQDCIWDVVVVGTGAGGATAGFNLARLGRSVLFIDRGNLTRKIGGGIRDAFAPPSDGKLAAGWWPHEVQREGDVDRKSQVVIGCGLGGSTALFGMVMDRFRPIDLTPGEFIGNAPGTSLPQSWPIQYEELEPYYEAAEALYRVRGTEDPLAPSGGPLIDPVPPSEEETIVHGALRQNGLHPYRLHYACERVTGCDGCVGRLCDRACRNDAARICMTPALERHGAFVLPDCRVVKLQAKGRAVHSALCEWNGRRLAIRARTFVLALHAMLTPALLLRSANASFPDGLGNTSGMVGRNLMSHVSDHLLVRFDGLSGSVNSSLHHGLSVNDFYVKDGAKLGNIHAHAKQNSMLTHSNEARGAALFHTIVEDFPYANNRVLPASGDDDVGVRWEYAHTDELRLRSRMLVDAFAEAIRPMGEIEVLEPGGTLNGGHVCGTCRFGDDPRTSVLDRNNRLHDVDNTYVVDASFFPSSGGINPSLTIAANSLRVSEHIATG